MRQRNEDIIRLRHMLEYAQRAVRFSEGKNRGDMDSDEMLAMATVHSIEIIGEAVKTISAELRQRYPEVPWNAISGTRNRLAHGYIDVDLDIIWSIVTKDLPPLIKGLQRILDNEGGHAEA